MPFYGPITSADQLPKVGEGFESEVRDFKATQDFNRRFEPAKDIAAFANHLGGTIVVGAAHAGGVIQSYNPMPAAIAELVENCYSQAADQRCRPEPVFHPARIPYDTGFVVAVNIEPSIPLVGVVAKEGDPGFAGPDNSGHDGWLFPMRVGTGTGFITAERLPMYMLPEVRRNVLLLRRIPKDARVSVTYLQTNDLYTNTTAALSAIDEVANVVILNRGSEQEKRWPLDQVETVFEGKDGWKIRFGIIAG